jgi:D-alanyl-D-alanine dipeptidase
VAAVIALLLVAGCGGGERGGGASTTVSSTTAPVASAAETSSSPSPAPSSNAIATPTPSRPAPVAPVSAKARADGLRDIRTIVPDAILDLRYATPHNFVGVRLYPRDARCLVHRSMAHGLAIAAHRLRAAGFLLVFWDCYRPHAVQVHMFRIVPNPDWVARPGPYATSHESGRSVDVTLARRSTRLACVSAHRVRGHCLLDMGTGFDDFTPRAYAYATSGVSPVAQANRARLRHAMAEGGLPVYSGEWWHFDGPGSFVHRPILDAPVD